MPQIVQAKPKVEISEEITCKLTFIVPIDPGIPRIPIFGVEEVSAVFSQETEDQKTLHDLASGIMMCEKVDHLTITRFRKQAKFEVQLTTKISNGTYGRIDALIRAAGWEPVSK